MTSVFRKDFPLLNREVRGHRLVYLDNAATTQKPQSVIDAITQFYTEKNANVHRGLHCLSETATQEYEGARKQVQSFINAPSADEIIFVRGVTEGINLIAQSYGRSQFRAGDEIIISAMEHHANIVPWLMLCEQIGTVLRVIPVLDDGQLDMAAYRQLLNPRTKLVSIVHASNVLGTVNPVEQIITLAHEHGVPVVIDGAQSIVHQRIDVQTLDCDFYLFSSHKMYGPTGIGVLYGKRAYLDAMPPYQGGGDMMTQVSFTSFQCQPIPHKFEAGTPAIAQTIGLGAAIRYLNALNFDQVQAHEKDLTAYAIAELSALPGLRIIGTAPERVSLVSFVYQDIHPHDIATILDSVGVAVRAGHHCAMPLMTRYNVPATARASFALYNTREEIDQLVAGLKKVREVFKG